MIKYYIPTKMWEKEVNMKYKYQVVITKSCEDEGYDVFIPVFGQVTDGDTYEAALKSAADVLDLIICEYIDMGRELPEYETVENGIDIEVDAEPNSYIRVYWYSPYSMTPEMANAIGEKIVFINDDRRADPELTDPIIKEMVDIIAIDAPTTVLNVQQFLLKIAKDKGIPMISPVWDTEGHEFKFIKWEQIDDIAIKKHDFEKIAK